MKCSQSLQCFAEKKHKHNHKQNFTAECTLVTYIIVQNEHHYFQCKALHGGPTAVLHSAVVLTWFLFLLLSMLLPRIIGTGY
jgi:hypothetical protein